MNIDIDLIDDCVFDVEMLKTDIHNNSAGELEAYRHTNIVLNSLINGQFKQAKQQCSDYGLNYAIEFHNYRNGMS